jgi:uncharacterized protein HemY
MVITPTRAENLKKYLKFKPKKVQEATQILPKIEKVAAYCKTQFSELKQAILRHLFLQIKFKLTNNSFS